MPRFASVIKEKSKSNVVLYRAATSDGQDFYAYIRCDEKQYHKIKHDFMTKTPCKETSDYGEVIYTRFGKEPDEEAKQFLSEYLSTL